MKTTLQITYQDGSLPKLVSYAELLTCQAWAGYNLERLQRLCRGQIRMFLTDIRGKACEIERVS